MEEEASWDEATRQSLTGQELRLGSQSRSLCPTSGCSLPLLRVADLDAPACCFGCFAPDPCDVCGEDILVGSLHFECPDCEDVKICTSCGPGVIIERQYDWFDSLTNEKKIAPLPSRTLHKRKSGRLSRKVQPSLKRGAVAPATLQLANQVVAQVQALCQSVAAEVEESADKDWYLNGELLKTLFGDLAGGDPTLVITQLAIGCSAILKLELTLNEVSTPCSIFGDIHGQLRDMLCFFNCFGAPWSSESSFLFNGDFVDRGKHQIEVIGVLFALKICYPDSVFMNRGNHEDPVQNKKYGFSSECQKFGDAGQVMLSEIWKCFDLLPLATRVGKRMLVLHGGIGTGLWDVQELKTVQRPLTHDQLQENDILYNILWSDPIAEDASMRSGAVFGVHPSPRGKLAVKFGWNVTQAFCEMNDLDIIVRSHQAISEGYGFDVMHDEKLMRVFSARDYEKHRNDGCVLAVGDDESRQTGDSVLVVRAQVLRSLSGKHRTR